MKEVIIVQIARTIEESFVFHKVFGDMDKAAKYIDDYSKLTFTLISNTDRMDDYRKYQCTIDKGIEFYLEKVKVY